jgi:hypothetical protein
MSDKELKQEIITKHGILKEIYFWIGNEPEVINKIKNKIDLAMEEWGSIISKRTEDNLLEELGFGDDPDRFNSSIDDVFGKEL